MPIRMPDGTEIDLEDLSTEEVRRTQWALERHHAARILASQPGPERARVTSEAYELIATILTHLQARERSSMTFGLQERDADLVHRLLGPAEPEPKHFFELGFGTGELITRVAAQGHVVAGVEVAASLADRVRLRIDRPLHDRIVVGYFPTIDLARFHGSIDVAYWNDVLEHVHPQEALSYLRELRALLRPGGILVTVTPNWHVRPSDITRLFRRPRSTAEGLHLKEYRLQEVTTLLESAGFDRVYLPLCCTRRRSFVVGNGLFPLKLRCEPALEYLPMRLARIVAGGFGYYCTLASVSRRDA